jgi:two-component sensor histidine kinase/PAS domain-containing protein
MDEATRSKHLTPPATAGAQRLGIGASFRTRSDSRNVSAFMNRKGCDDMTIAATNLNASGRIDFTGPFASMEDGHSLAQAVVDTLSEPLLVLDAELRVVAASRAFCERFGIDPREVVGRPYHTIGGGQWAAPELRALLQRVLPEQRGMEAFEFEQEFQALGRRRFLLNARTVFFEGTAQKMILVAMEDVTAWRAAETAMSAVLAEKEFRLQEMQHRVANSLQLIASILLIKAKSVQSAETRDHLQDAHQRVMSIAAVQEQLRTSGEGGIVSIGPYLNRLCETLTASMVTSARPISIGVDAAKNEALSSEAVSLGLIVTELLINAVKHAFPRPKADAVIRVDYRVIGAGWALDVSDNGVGHETDADGPVKPGLGSSIIEALARKLGADVVTVTGTEGTRVSVRTAPVGGQLSTVI